MWTVRTRALWTLMLVLSLLLVFVSSRYLTLNPAVYFPRQRAFYEAHTTWLLIHIVGMMLTALLGPFQFLRSFRVRQPRIHRILGRVYISGALVGGVGGLYLAQHSASGTISDIGFGLLAVLTIATTAMAFKRILGGAVQSHREWMVRSYSLTLAAVTLRIYMPLLEAALGEQDGYALVAWLCWMPNLIVAECLIRGPFRRHAEPRRTAVRIA